MYDRSCYVVNAMTDIADRTTGAPRRKRADGSWIETPARPTDLVAADDVVFIRESIF